MSSRKNKIEIALAMAVLLLLVQVPVCRADYTIDADLSDWGVTPFTDWEPDGTADYNETDDRNFYNVSGWDELFDFEALYFDDDLDNFYFAVVTSLPSEWHSGDLGIDLNGDASVGSEGIVTGIEYAIRIYSYDPAKKVGDVVVNPTWASTWQDKGHPWKAEGGTVIGSAEVVKNRYPYLEHGTNIFEVAVPRHLFNDVLEIGDPVTCHISAGCGNDSINVVADVNVNTPVRMYIRCDRDSTANPTVNRMLADDFQRDNTGRVTKVFLWGGWKNNIKGQIDTIHLSLHADDNAQDPNSPGNLLWSGDFTPADFNETYYAQDNGWSWFWDPATGQDPCYAIDMGIWQYEISIDPYYAFVHQGDPCDPCTYWLDAHVVVQPDANNPQFVLKTTIDHWNKDAVYWSDSNATWKELHYPKDHPLEPNSIDLAFSITSSEVNLPDQEWIQPPIPIDPNDYLDPNIPVYSGWDEESRYYGQDTIWFIDWNCPTQCHGDADKSRVINNFDVDIVVNAWLTTYYDPCYNPNADFDRDLDVDYDDLDILTWWLLDNNTPPGDCPPQKEASSWKLVADDFRPLGTMPITSVRWWGSYSGWPHMERPFNGDPDAWRIGFWSSSAADPCNPTSFSRPAKLLWQIEVENNRVKVNNVGRYEDLDTCFMYCVKLEPNEAFRPANHIGSTQEDIFWLSIAAVYPDGGYIEFPWGWNTRPNSWRYAAVTFTMDGPLDVNVQAPPIITQLKRSDQAYDVAFEMDTDPNLIKWEQPFVDWWRIFNYWDIRFRGWKHYEDEESMATHIETQDPNIERLVADDWKCEDKKPVTAITWWGSYIGYRYDPCNLITTLPPIRPKYFLLSIWDDVPKNDQNPYSHPDTVIWSYKAYAYDEVMVGYDKHYRPGDIDGDHDVDLLDLSELADAWLTLPGHPSWDPLCDISVPPDDTVNWLDFAVLAGHWLSESEREPVFRYSVTLPDANQFGQTGQGNIYWLSIVAVYPNHVKISYPWGWTNHRHAFNDDAVAGHLEQDGWVWEELRDQSGKSEDMSFVLFKRP